MHVCDVIQRAVIAAAPLSKVATIGGPRNVASEHEKTLVASFAGVAYATLFRPLSKEELSRFARMAGGAFRAPSSRDAEPITSGHAEDSQLVQIIDVTYDTALNPGLDLHTWLVELFFSDEPMRLAFADVLLHYGANPDAFTGTSSRLMHSCSKTDDVGFASLLIKHGASVDALTSLEDGNTPLMIAIRHCSRKMIEFLVENGADTVMRNSSGSNAIELARSAGLEGHLLSKNAKSVP